MVALGGGEVKRWVIPFEVDGGGRFLLSRKGFVPAYIRAYEAGALKEKVEEALALLSPQCRVCPRYCKGIDRGADKTGVCRIGRYAWVASAFPHFGEEDVLRGWNGSGTIFFSGCNLRCVFCQNWDISQQRRGQECSPRDLARLMVALQEMGCHNINLVTPEHVVPQVVEALPLAVEMGLRLPLVYNTSSYDSPESLRVLDGLVDIYMPDFKFWDREYARTYLLAPDYPEAARHSIAEMHRQVGVLHVDENGLALRGVLVRHLVMPGMLEDTAQILRWLASLSPDTYVNVMEQYHPAWKAATDPRFASINRPVTGQEMATAYRLAREAGLWRLDTRWRRVWVRFARRLPLEISLGPEG
jgi:putative pyruvate formate lyase activating enzyme